MCTCKASGWAARCKSPELALVTTLNQSLSSLSQIMATEQLISKTKVKIECQQEVRNCLCHLRPESSLLLMGTSVFYPRSSCKCFVFVLCGTRLKAVSAHVLLAIWNRALIWCNVWMSACLRSFCIAIVNGLLALALHTLVCNAFCAYMRQIQGMEPSYIMVTIILSC